MKDDILKYLSSIYPVIDKTYIVFELTPPWEREVDSRERHFMYRAVTLFEAIFRPDDSIYVYDNDYDCILHDKVSNIPYKDIMRELPAIQFLYFINKDKDIIFLLQGVRNCAVYSKSTDIIKYLHFEYPGWVSD
jgi:hypothetical protein